MACSTAAIVSHMVRGEGDWRAPAGSIEGRGKPAALTLPLPAL